MRKEFPRFLISWYYVLLLTIMFTLLYLAFRSNSYDDADSYNFALALRHFSLSLHQPQPPGFPVYIAIGRLILLLCDDPRSALTLLSAICGVTVIIAIYNLGNLEGFQPLASVGAALLVGFSPMGWLTAEKALSDTPGLAITLWSMWALWKGANNPALLIIGGGLTGLGLGLRPQNGLPVLLLLLGLLIHYLRKRKPLRILLAAIFSFTVGVLLWLVPTVYTEGGFNVYWSHVSAHAAHVRFADSIFGGPITVDAVKERGYKFLKVLLLHAAGFDLNGEWNWRKYAHLLAIMVILFPGILATNWQHPYTWFLLGWSFISSLQIFLIEAIDYPRLFLPILPPLALLVSKGWNRIQTRFRLFALIYLSISFALMLYTLPLAKQISTIIAPPSQATAYIAANYSSENTILAAAGSFRAAQVELPQYRVFYLYRFDFKKFQEALQENSTRYIIILDWEHFPEEIVQLLTNDRRWMLIDEQTFSRDPRVHPQHFKVILRAFANFERIPQEEVVLPPSGCVDVGNKQDWKYLREGWYRAGYYEENIGGVNGRWAGDTAILHFVISSKQQGLLAIKMRALAYPHNQEVTLYINGKYIANLALKRTWETYTVITPAEFFAFEKVNELKFVHKFVAVPFKESGGISADQRQLAAAYDWICITEP